MAYSALSTGHKEENRRDLGGGLEPRHQQSVTGVTGGSLDTTWGAPELAELENVIQRQGEIVQALKDLGILS